MQNYIVKYIPLPYTLYIIFCDYNLSWKFCNTVWRSLLSYSTRHVNNAPKIEFWTESCRNTKLKSFILLLTLHTSEFRYSALCYTFKHAPLYVCRWEYVTTVCTSVVSLFTECQNILLTLLYIRRWKQSISVTNIMYVNRISTVKRFSKM